MDENVVVKIKTRFESDDVFDPKRTIRQSVIIIMYYASLSELDFALPFSPGMVGTMHPCLSETRSSIPTKELVMLQLVTPYSTQTCLRQISSPSFLQERDKIWSRMSSPHTYYPFPPSCRFTRLSLVESRYPRLGS